MRTILKVNRLLLISFILLIANSILLGQTFQSTNYNLSGVYNAGVDWGDADNDGDLDLIIIGSASNSGSSKYYENFLDTSTHNSNLNSGTIDVGIYNYTYADVRWGDFDNDGDLDYVVAGSVSSCSYAPLVLNNLIPAIERNLPQFIDIGLTANLQKMRDPNLRWGDYDNDGDLDLLMCGDDVATGYHTNFYENKNGVLIPRQHPFPAVYDPIASWVDYDNDGDLDVFISGGGNGFQSILFENRYGGFVNSNIVMPKCAKGDADWGDFDNDGDLDLIIVGDTAYKKGYTGLYRNDQGSFTEISHNFVGVYNASCAFGDFDNDGDLDIAISGDTSTASVTIKPFSGIYCNDGNGNMTLTYTNIDQVTYSKLAWADYDNDYDLDLIITGRNYSGNHTEIYNYSGLVPNTQPSIPSGLSSTPAGDSVLLNWANSTDNETPQNSLSYNIYMGTHPKGIDITTPMSDLESGYRKIVRNGNAMLNNYWFLRSLQPGQYFWSVQSIDQGFLASGFAQEQSFILIDQNAVTLIYPYINQEDVSVIDTCHWLSFNGASNYRIQISTDSLFLNTPIIDSVVSDTSLVLNQLEFHKDYFWRVDAQTTSGWVGWSVTRKFTTIPRFTENGQLNKNSYYGKADFGDFQDDKDFDLSYDAWGGIYIYENGNYVEDTSVILKPNHSCNKWVDYDNDGDLDLSISGSINPAGIFRNDNDSLVLVLPISNNTYTYFDWGDFDNDGDQDLASGSCGFFRNNNSQFNYEPFPIPAGADVSFDWGDYDGDLDLDLLLMINSSGAFYSLVLQNDDSVFTENYLNLPYVGRGEAHWGDFDQDAKLDVLITGQNSNSQGAQNGVYKFSDGTFKPYFILPDEYSNGGNSWGDFDNDGDLDFVVTGKGKTEIYYNNGQTFVKGNEMLVGLNSSHVNVGDFDGDNDLDLFIYGTFPISIGGSYNMFLINNTQKVNHKPLPPALTEAIFINDTIHFYWTSGSDAETDSLGLTYNFFFGPAPTLIDSMTPMAHLDDGTRKIIDFGNAGPNLGWKIYGIQSGSYYWGVQSIDNCFIGSDFSTIEHVTFLNIEEEEEETLNIYPNPTNGITNLVFTSDKQPKRLRVFSIDGKLIKDTQLNLTGSLYKIDLSNINNGHYKLQVIYDDQSITKSILISR